MDPFFALKQSFHFRKNFKKKIFDPPPKKFFWPQILPKISSRTQKTYLEASTPPRTLWFAIFLKKKFWNLLLAISRPQIIQSLSFYFYRIPPPKIYLFWGEKVFEKNVWSQISDFREVILKVFPASKRAEIATIRFVTPELYRLYFLGAKKSSKFIEIWHFQNRSFFKFLAPTKKYFLTPNFHPPPPHLCNKTSRTQKTHLEAPTPNISPWFAIFLHFLPPKIGFLAISRLYGL